MATCEYLLGYRAALRHLFENQAVSWRFSEAAIKNKNSTPPYSADNLLMEEMAEAFSAYEQDDKRHALQVRAVRGDRPADHGQAGN